MAAFLILFLVCAPNSEQRPCRGLTAMTGSLSPSIFYFGDWQDDQDIHSSSALQRMQECWADSAALTLASASKPHPLPGASSLLGAPLLLN